MNFLLDLVRHGVWFGLVFGCLGLILLGQIILVAKIRSLPPPRQPSVRQKLVGVALLSLSGIVIEGIFLLLYQIVLPAFGPSFPHTSPRWVVLPLAGGVVGAILGNVASPYVTPARSAIFGVVAGFCAAVSVESLPLDLLTTSGFSAETTARFSVALTFALGMVLSEKWPLPPARPKRVVPPKPPKQPKPVVETPIVEIPTQEPELEESNLRPGARSIRPGTRDITPGRTRRR